MSMDSRPSIAQEAAEWLLELNGAGASRRAEFLEWLRRSPEHVREFLGVTSLTRRLRDVDPQRSLDVKQLLADAELDVARLPGFAKEDVTRLRPRSVGRRPLLALAASVVIAVSGAAFWLMQSASDVYVTRVGELRSFSLSDGSLIELNTNSRAEVRYSKTGREVSLIKGEALFTVQHDARRPFTVRAGSMAVTAVGTRFNVYRQSKELVTVAVLQGAVRVENRTGSDQAALGTSSDGAAPPEATAFLLKAGEQATSRRAAVVSKTAISQAADVVAWRQRQLVFRDAPLSQVVSEFNRYNERQIILEGDAGENRQITGTFTAEKPESLVEFLRRDRQLRLEEGEDALVVREAR